MIFNNYRNLVAEELPNFEGIALKKPNVTPPQLVSLVAEYLFMIKEINTKLANQTREALNSYYTLGSYNWEN